MGDVFDELQSDYSYYYAANGNFAKIEHGHVFYEFFLTLNDNVVHVINGKEQLLRTNTLVFVRPGDRHFFKRNIDTDPNFINLAFRKEIAERFFMFLFSRGEELQRIMVESPMPPSCVLSNREKRHVEFEMNRFSAIDENTKEELQLKLCFFVAETFSLFAKKILKVTDDVANIPFWLENVCDKMKHFENFSEGLPRMLELSGKTHEHLSRSMKKYKNITVSTFINNLRLEYIASMLKNSDLSVTELCFESGFNSLDHFEKLFKNKYGVSPSNFRKGIKRKITKG